MGIIQKVGNWVPYELKPRDVKRRFFTCEQLLQHGVQVHRIIKYLWFIQDKSLTVHSIEVDAKGLELYVDDNPLDF
ncbi:hypothetical protein LAZ67_15000451 [Cordylochernes scorpioides]|uniref:Uncharacterized protein n=1 Tax=Cordylochernes scorpioides TaxID=51811 RepID=A0ABY6L823_9ARAC|nr:hypothetical protein LAZ67_15000451 [Cordylochernes scorpioides]